MKFSQFIEDSSLSFHSPITQDEWDRITDVELENTETITFKTPSGKEVPFRKAKRGEWIEKDEYSYYCSNCRAAFFDRPFNIKKENTSGEWEVFTDYFCPNCGADMRGETE